MLETPTLPSSAGHKSPRSIYMKILTWIRGFRVKIANCSPLDCLAIPRRKSSTKKTKPNIEKWPESLGVMLEFQYRTWAIAIEYFTLPRWGTSQFCLLLCSLVPPVLLTLFCVCSGCFHWGCGQQWASLLQLFFKECFGRKAFCWGLRFHACLMDAVNNGLHCFSYSLRSVLDEKHFAGACVSMLAWWYLIILPENGKP